MRTTWLPRTAIRGLESKLYALCPVQIWLRDSSPMTRIVMVDRQNACASRLAPAPPLTALAGRSCSSRTGGGTLWSDKSTRITMTVNAPNDEGFKKALNLWGLHMGASPFYVEFEASQTTSSGHASTPQVKAPKSTGSRHSVSSCKTPAS